MSQTQLKKLVCPVWLNQTQYFEDVSSQVPLEGYQVCQKWLNERQGSSLSEQDIQQYKRIVTLLKEITELILEIYAAIQHSQFKNFPVFEKLQIIIAEQLSIEQNQVCLESNFVENLRVDSLDILELFTVLEKAFDIQINDEVAKSLSTVQKLVNYISQKVVI
ncbi:acyl carrier protein [Chlorogloeopsis sp. ULAP01]|uniref:acyl carrier protein n=1 Tax=Chlorogloeopsis sp. ULAP01 TaxID=3056483 RepID=UPI0025AA5055|nr:acyl carrier protein [Chlorogloeopsis sp. ULAP01]MDM9379440.1 acyl carrier protein [Chlorogloeopsis sp. ULAP01]